MRRGWEVVLASHDPRAIASLYTPPATHRLPPLLCRLHYPTTVRLSPLYCVCSTTPTTTRTTVRLPPLLHLSLYDSSDTTTPNTILTTPLFASLYFANTTIYCICNHHNPYHCNHHNPYHCNHHNSYHCNHHNSYHCNHHEGRCSFMSLPNSGRNFNIGMMV